MIATWMAYALVAGALVALLCCLLERIARDAALPTRGIWVAGMVAMLLITGVALLQPAPTSVTRGAARTAGSAASAAAVESASQPATPGAAVDRLRQRAEGALIALDARVGAAAARLAPWDGPLLLGWALLGAFLAGIVAHAAFEGLRLRDGLQAREIAGTPVLLTDGIGPSAVGVGGDAVLLPRWALELDDELVALVVRHEREHLAARDPLLLLATLLMAVLVPWQLPLWWCRRRLRLAVEVDCDRRVLRAHPDVRRYGELLLLTAGRAATPSLASLPVFTVVAPLRPHKTHLGRRISVMTEHRTPGIPSRAFPLALAALAVATLVAVLPRPGAAGAQESAARERAVVRLTSLGAIDTTDPISLVVYATGGAQVGVGTESPRTITDTLRLDRLPAITADVTEGEVHIELRGPGAIRVGGEVRGGPATHLTATGHHLVLLKGGVGIRSVP